MEMALTWLRTVYDV